MNKYKRLSERTRITKLYKKKPYHYRNKKPTVTDYRIGAKSCIAFSTRDDITLSDIANRLFSVYEPGITDSIGNPIHNKEFMESVIFSYCCKNITDISDKNIDQFVALATGKVTSWSQLYDKAYVRSICNKVMNGIVKTRLDWYYLVKFHSDQISKESFRKYTKDMTSFKEVYPRI